jgi:tetratricopeptide (TPR) repeat protein
MDLLKNRPTRALILVMIAFVIAGLVIAKIYYTRANNSIDPRIIPARQLYSKYDTYASIGNYNRLFSLLDSIETIYKKYKHYSNSYELGVLKNNRSAALITIALYSDSIRADFNPFFGVNRDSLLLMAEENALGAIAYYENWLLRYSGKSKDEIAKEIEDQFFSDFVVESEKERKIYLKARAKEISVAVLEADRRLSVSYTNLGVLYRVKGDLEAAARQYKKALDLWDRNLSAENNVNSLLGRPIKKRNILQKLFPPERGG